MFSAKISREFKNSGISTPSIYTSRPSRDHIALSNPNNNVKILTQAYCICIVSLSLLKLGIAQDEIRKALLIKQRTE